MKKKVKEARKTRPIRMTDAEWEKCKRIGGSKWVRGQVKAARDVVENND